MNPDFTLSTLHSDELCKAIEKGGVICFKKQYCKGYCHVHYHRVRRGGSVNLPTKKVNSCKFIDCDKPSHCKNMCKQHYRQHITRTTENRCKVEECNKRTIAKYCPMHRSRLERYGTTDGSGRKKGSYFKPGNTYITPKQYKVCLAKSCGRDSNDYKITKGLCPKHYRRWSLTGNYEDVQTIRL